MLPTWANEGLAEYYSTFAVGRNERDFTIGSPIANHIQVLRSNSFIPLETLFSVTHDSPYYNEADKQGVFYAESWALVHYLLNGKNRTLVPRFSSFVSLLSADKPVADSFREVFEKDYEAFEKEFRDYVRANNWMELRLILDEGFAAEKEMKVTPLSDGQSEYYLGDLLFHLQRMSEAETHLAKAIALEPALGPAHASLGMLRIQQKQYPEALSLLKRAIAADSRNHLVHFYYADMLDRLNRDDALPEEDYASKDETMRTHLLKSIELNPAFLGAYGLLAQVNLPLGEQLPETERLLNTAMSLAPGRQDLTLLLAQTMLRSQKTDQARALLTPIARSATDPSLRKQAELILQNFDLYSGDLNAIRESLARREITSSRIETPQPAAPAPSPPSPPRSTLPASRGREPLLEALTPLELPEGEHVTGLLTLLDCSSGLTLHITTDSETLQLHSANPGNIQFLSYSPDVSTSITCGPRTPATPVTVTFRKENQEPLVVEFIQKD
jgi:tetratricopeptide (TPR) repeat protein